MKCFICNQYFSLRRSFNDFLKVKKYFICNHCYKEYPINLKFTLIPLDKYYLKVYTLFDKNYYFKGDPFILEYSKIFNYLKNKYLNIPILIYKTFFMNYQSLEILNSISTIFSSDIIILAYDMS